MFSLLFILHLRYGCFNHVQVPLRFRMDIDDQKGGKVAGGLLGVRLSLVEFILSSATRYNEEDCDEDVLVISDSDSDSDSDLVLR